MSEEIGTWADGSGNWWACVPISACDLVGDDLELVESRLEDMAREAIMGELAQRDNPANDMVRAAGLEMAVVLVPSRSSATHAVYTERYWPWSRRRAASER